MKLKANAGNIEIRTTKFQNLEVETDFGNVVVRDVEDIDSYDIDCEIDLGSIQIGGNVSSKSYTSKGTGAGTIKIECDAGNIEIR